MIPSTDGEAKLLMNKANLRRGYIEETGEGE